MNRIVTLGIDSAINAIKNEEMVMCKSGVWNNYSKCTAAAAMDRIKNSSYGADVYEDENGMKYVSMPCASDMW